MIPGVQPPSERDDWLVVLWGHTRLEVLAEGRRLASELFWCLVPSGMPEHIIRKEKKISVRRIGAPNKCNP